MEMERVMELVSPGQTMGDVMPQRSNGGLPPSGRAGFTLIELMVTIAVLAIITAIAVPSMRALILANRLTAASTELVTALQLARSEAIRRNAPVTVCSTANGTACSGAAAWDRWIILGHDNTSGADEVIRDTSAQGGVQVSGPAAGIRFRPSGMLNAQAAVTACLPVDNPSDNQRVITMMVGGGVATDKHNGGGACP